MPKIRNITAKYARKFNKAVIMADRKKLTKKGYQKHRKNYANTKVSS